MIEIVESLCVQENLEIGRIRYMGIWQTSWSSQERKPEDSLTPFLGSKASHSRILDGFKVGLALGQVIRMRRRK
jgi:hypothetical protein